MISEIGVGWSVNEHKNKQIFWTNSNHKHLKVSCETHECDDYRQ